MRDFLQCTFLSIGEASFSDSEAKRQANKSNGSDSRNSDYAGEACSVGRGRLLFSQGLGFMEDFFLH